MHLKGICCCMTLSSDLLCKLVTTSPPHTRLHRLQQIYMFNTTLVLRNLSCTAAVLW